MDPAPLPPGLPSHPGPAGSPVPPAPASFPIRYEVFAGAGNPDLQGAGVFSVTLGEKPYVFSGRPRGLFATGKAELRFGPDDIRNVVISGRAVQFATSLGRAGAKNQPFVFVCEDERAALAAADALPKTRDSDYTAAADFQARLRALPGARHPMASVTNLIIAANVLVFLVMAGFLGAGWGEATSLLPYIRYGANNAAATTDGEWWRLVTSMFMHFGFLHLALNMWALYQTGHLVERLQGRLLYSLTYLGSGLGGGFVSLVWHGAKTWSAGASGAIFGIYGALLGHILREKESVPRAVFQPLLKSTLTFGAYNLLWGFAHPGIDNADHIGGLVAGLILGWLTALPLDLSARAALEPKKVRLALGVIAAIVVVGVATAPRFDYSVSEELAWSDALAGTTDRETALLTRENEELTRWHKSPSRDEAYGRFIDDELVPFYRDFLQKVQAVPLTPGRSTDKRRNIVADFARLRLEAWQHLSRAVRQNDQQEFQAYTQAEAKASAVLKSLK